MDDGLVVETRELGKRYDERILAVDKLSWRVRRGEVYGFLGPNDVGKTTTLRRGTKTAGLAKTSTDVSGLAAAVMKPRHNPV